MGKKRWGLWISAVVTLAVIAILARYQDSLRSVCRNEVLAEIPSADGRRVVIVFERDCGATTGFSTQASLLPAGAALPNESGNLFVADAGHGAAPAGPGGGPNVEVIWENGHSVAVRMDPKARVFKAKKEIDGVHVTYGTLAPAVPPDLKSLDETKTE
jgi:hypothetical protein